MPLTGRLLVNYVRLNIVAVLVAIACLVAIRFWVAPDGWVDVIVGIHAGLVLCLLATNLLLRRGIRVPAIMTVAVANWITVVTVAALVPFALTIVPICVLLPVLLAVPYLRRFQLNAMLGTAVLVIVATAAGGRFTDGVGLEPDRADLFDYYERALLNQMVGQQNPNDSHGHVCYFTRTPSTSTATRT